MSTTVSSTTSIITSTSSGFSTSSIASVNAVTPIKTKSTRHTRRCGWFYTRYFKTFEFMQRPISDRIQCKMNPGQVPLFTDEEVEMCRDISEKMAKMYNERFNSYRKLIAEEKGLDPAPYTKENKYILKCIK